MKNDYLWDKSGDDAEIEGLENLLAGFKYTPTAAPVIVPAVAIENAPARLPWWKISLGFAVPACLLMAIVFGFWATRNQVQAPATIAGGDSPALAADKPSIITPERYVNDPDSKTDAPKALKTVFTSRTKADVYRSEPARYRPVKKKEVMLTAEERYAYDQLKLALSITGSKLKVVSDTVNRAED